MRNEKLKMQAYSLTTFITFLLFLSVSNLAVGQIRYGNQGRINDDKVEISYANPKTLTIAAIEVEGAEFLDKNALISISGLKVGDEIKIPGDIISGAIKKLWKQGLISDVRIYATKVVGDDVYLKIKLTERPRLSRFQFSGINKSQEGDLREKIDLIKGRIMTDAIKKNAERKIKKYFYEKGYLNARVGIHYQLDTTLHNGVLLDFNIQKNKKVKVRDIHFVGNEYYTEGKLRSKLKNTGEQPRFKIVSALIASLLDLFKPKAKRQILSDSSGYTSSQQIVKIINDHVKLNVFKSSKYVVEKFEEDKASLIKFYQTKGYRDAEIVRDSVRSVGNGLVDINIKVKPGKRYYFGNIDWKGNFIYTDQQLDEILAIKKGEVYNPELLSKKLNFNPNGPDISSLYMDNGYLFFQVNPIETKINGDSVDVEMRIFEGTQATIRKVSVMGNDRTNDHVIMRELRTLPGEKFSRAQLIRTQRELSQLGYFDPEKINPKPIPDPENETVDIVWEVVERPSDQIELSGGWGGNFGFIGTLGLSFNNFSVRNIPHLDKWRPLPVGDGQKLSLRLQANGVRFQSYSVSFSEPWLGGKKPNSFGVSFNYSIQRNINLRTREVFGSLQVLNSSVSLGRRLKWPDDYFTLVNAVSYKRYNLFNFGNSLGFNTGVANNLTLNTTLARNSVDNNIFPRTGASVSLSLALTPPWSLWNGLDYTTAPNEKKYEFVEYHKWMFDAKYYLNIVGNLVLQTRAHLGFIGAYQASTGIGPFERFQVGGDGLTGTNFLLGNDIIGLRGYPNNSIRPQNTTNNFGSGSIYNKFVMEFRYPVSLNPSATIYVLAFSEAGNNWDGFSNYNPNKLFKSSGVGVRIFMPAFGLLGIDWGYGYDTLPGQNRPSGGQIHFSIGAQQLR